jgi:phosphomannomutase
VSGGHIFHSTVLREYDIRGIVGETLGAADAVALGRAFGSRIVAGGGRRVCVGYDGRISSPELEAALTEGLAACGLAVLRVGRGPTPMLYYAVHTLEADGGIMVTGSHNPPDHNGFKLMLGTRTLFGHDIAALGEVAAAGDFASGEGSQEAAPVREEYVTALAAAFRGQRSLSVAWDAGNGAAGEMMAELTARLPGRHVLLNEIIDGTFPAHHPDPTVAENLVQLQQAVRAERCDMGFAFDGDGDRIGVVDGAGRIIWGDQIMALLAREVLAERPGATIIADVKSSRVFFDEVARLGGEPLMWRTGHSLIKAKMAELGAPLAGEMSGHIFFADRWYGFDDALYVAVRFLSMAAAGEASVAELRDSLPAMVNTPELRFECPEERKFEVVSEVRDRLAAAGAEFDDIDGVRVNTADGWWLLRASNTQAVLVARCEAADEAGLDRLKDQLLDQLDMSEVEPPVL